MHIFADSKHFQLFFKGFKTSIHKILYVYIFIFCFLIHFYTMLICPGIEICVITDEFFITKNCICAHKLKRMTHMKRGIYIRQGGGNVKTVFFHFNLKRNFFLFWWKFSFFQYHPLTQLQKPLQEWPKLNPKTPPIQSQIKWLK